MSEPDVLKHLLEIEETASKIVSEAEEEANRQVIENDKNCRETYNKNYAGQVAAISAEYADKRAKLEADYNRRLEEYRSGLAGGASEADGGAGVNTFASMFAQFLGIE